MLLCSLSFHLFSRTFQLKCLISCGPRGRHLDLDLLQTGLVSPHPSYYLLCLTCSQFRCLFVFFESFFSPAAQQDPAIAAGVGRPLRKGRHALRIDIAGMEKILGHLENGRDKKWLGFRDGKYEERE